MTQCRRYSAGTLQTDRRGRVLTVPWGLAGILADREAFPGCLRAIAMTDVTSPRLPSEIKLEMLSSGDQFLPKITEILGSLGSPEGDAIDWSRTLQKYLAEGNAMIVSARTGRSLIGFMVLDPARASAPCSWVSQRFRDKGLGQRFYSFACIMCVVKAFGTDWGVI